MWWLWQAFGLKGSFVVSAMLHSSAAVAILFMWGENYGDSKAAGSGAITRAINEMRADTRIALLGFSQSLFDSSMYTFVFLWPMSFAVWPHRHCGTPLSRCH
jgi:MFS transporter, MFS domain-containing protein family, molybdate-anion transporter